MRIISFKVQPRIPDNLKKLEEIAWNLWFSWNWEAVQLFLRIDENLWIESYQTPVRMLSLIPQELLEELSQDDSFVASVNRVHEDFTRYLEMKTWFSKTYPAIENPTIAYFSFEYGIDEGLPIYSGGLGILSGDHIKAASDLGVPLTAVGLLYRQGYFKQYLNIDGYQQEFYPENDWATMPVIREVDHDGAPLFIEVAMAGHPVKVGIWKAIIGRVQLFLLDTNIPENSPKDREITAQLYGGDREMRIQQEILLGIGGIRVLCALGLDPVVCHMNEGHSAFLALERIRQLMKKYGLTFNEARMLTRSSTVFTTHTPVPAGNERFDVSLVKRYFESFVADIGFSWNEFVALGSENSGYAGNSFCMTVLALRMATSANGVSKLHGQVSRTMWQNIWEDIPRNEIPIGHVTNGIHVRSFLSHDMADLYERYLGPDFIEASIEEQVWNRIKNIPDAEIWRTHERRRERLVGFVRRRLSTQLSKRGVPEKEIAYANEVLDPGALTIGFARRFATYKRAGLILRYPERLERLLMDQDHPVQIVFAGKAHPQDTPGKEIIRSLVHFSRDERFRKRVIFIEDYDIQVARYFVQGVDVWLNTPRRPLEASGTSGMKAAVNGALNLSVLDGWWDEAYREDVGWAIGSGEEYQDLEKQDEIESRALYNILEQDIIPLFYERGSDGLPRKWIGKMKNSMSILGRVYNSHRMVIEYVDNYYMPAISAYEKLTADNLIRVREFTQWEDEIRKAWKTIKIVDITADTVQSVKAGDKLPVTTTINIGKIKPEDISVEIYYGPLDSNGNIIDGTSLSMEISEDTQDGLKIYKGLIPCEGSGRWGFSVRVLPRHSEMICRNEPPIITWG